MILNKKFILVVSVVLVVLLFGYLCFFNNVSIKKNESSSNNVEYVFIKKGVTLKKTNIYKLENNKYKKIGEVRDNLIFEFSDIVDGYLLVKGFDDDYFIEARDVKGSSNVIENSKRYEKYILFNENIITKDVVSFYNENGDFLYKFNLSFEFPIIVKDDNRYGIEFNNQLLYVDSSDVVEVKKSYNTDKKNSSGVGVLNYHFFYDENNQEEVRICNQEICQSKKQLRGEIDYLKNNNIFTITTKELEWYIDGKIKLPKSVLITIDDGWMMETGIKMLEENEMNACVFLITSWFDNINFADNYKYIEFHSHGEELHNVGSCPGGQGGAIKCLEKDKLLDDLSISRRKLKDSTVFAYPFYEYNNYSIEVLKEAGFSMAFAGENSGSDNLVHVGSDKYRLLRFVMVNYTTQKDLDRYFGNID